MTNLSLSRGLPLPLIESCPPPPPPALSGNNRGTVFFWGTASKDYSGDMACGWSPFCPGRSFAEPLPLLAGPCIWSESTRWQPKPPQSTQKPDGSHFRAPPHLEGCHSAIGFHRQRGPLEVADEEPHGQPLEPADRSDPVGESSVGPQKIGGFLLASLSNHGYP